MSDADDRSPQSRPRSFLASAVAVFGTNLGVAALGLLNVLLVARALGPAGRGDVAFLTTVTNLAHYASTMGVQEATINFASRDRSLRRALAGNSVLLGLVFGGLAAALIAGLVALVPSAGGEADRHLLWLSLATVPVLVLARYLRLLVQADFDFGITNVAWFVTPVVSVFVNGSLAAAGALTVTYAVSAWLFGQVLTAALLVAWVARHGGFGWPDLGLARASVAFGARSHAGQLLLIGNYRLDQWIVGAVAGSRELGLYSVAVAWAETLFYLPQALASVQRPRIVRDAVHAAVRSARLVLRAALLVTLPLAIGLVIGAPLLVALSFGSEFGGAVDDLRVLGVGAFGIVATKLLGDALTARGLPLRASAATAVGFTVMLLLDVLLIPVLGGLGAAIASSASYLAGGLAMALLFTGAFGGRVADLLPRPSDVAMLRRNALFYGRGGRLAGRRSAAAPERKPLP